MLSAVALSAAAGGIACSSEVAEGTTVVDAGDAGDAREAGVVGLPAIEAGPPPPVDAGIDAREAGPVGLPAQDAGPAVDAGISVGDAGRD